MMKLGLTLTLFLSLNSYAGGKLLSATSSSEQDILRLELNFDRLIDSSAIEVQYSNKSMNLTLPDVAFKKAAPFLEAKSSFTKSLKLKSANEKNLTLEIEFNDVTALQMKENLAVESLGKTLIIEVLPPNIQNANASAKDSVLASDLPPTLPGKAADKTDVSSTKAKNTDASVTKDTPSGAAANAVTDESQIPLFEKKAEHKAEDSVVTKIIFMVLGLIALGGYLIWFLKNKTKMVNGPESLMKIKMVTQFHIGPKKSLAVIRVAGESLLLAVTETQITLIKSLALLDEDLPEVTPTDFAQSLEEEERPAQRSSKSNREFSMDTLNTEEEFSFGPAVKTSLTKNSLTNKITMLRKII